MSVFLLAGVGRTGWRRVPQEGRGDVARGEVLVPRIAGDAWRASGMDETPSITDQQYIAAAVEKAATHRAGTNTPTYITVTNVQSDAPPSGVNLIQSNINGTDKGDKPPNGGSHYQRIVGRASAWVCTTLYLTSRLPQIWKNVSTYCSSLG